MRPATRPASRLSPRACCRPVRSEGYFSRPEAAHSDVCAVLTLRPLSTCSTLIVEAVPSRPCEGVRNALLKDRCAAVAAFRGRKLGSQCLTRSCHRLVWQCGSINGRYLGRYGHASQWAAGYTANSRLSANRSKGRTPSVDPEEAQAQSEQYAARLSVSRNEPTELE
jgi:hypothetical protein